MTKNIAPLFTPCFRRVCEANQFRSGSIVLLWRESMWACENGFSRRSSSSPRRHPCWERWSFLATQYGSRRCRWTTSTCLGLARGRNMGYIFVYDWLRSGCGISLRFLLYTSNGYSQDYYWYFWCVRVCWRHIATPQLLSSNIWE